MSVRLTFSTQIQAAKPDWSLSETLTALINGSTDSPAQMVLGGQREGPLLVGGLGEPVGYGWSRKSGLWDSLSHSARAVLGALGSRFSQGPSAFGRGLGQQATLCSAGVGSLARVGLSLGQAPRIALEMSMSSLRLVKAARGSAPRSLLNPLALPR